MTDTVVEAKEAVTITSQAAENILNLMAEKELVGHSLRIYVAGIGCSGPQYGLAFDENPREDDNVIETAGLKILVDPNSLVYLEGRLQINSYEDNGQTRYFTKVVTSQMQMLDRKPEQEDQ